MFQEIPREALDLFTTRLEGQPIRAVVRRSGGWSFGAHANGQPVEQNEILVLGTLEHKLLRHGHLRLLVQGEKTATCKECKRTFLESGMTVHQARVHGVRKDND